MQSVNVWVEERERERGGGIVSEKGFFFAGSVLLDCGCFSRARKWTRGPRGFYFQERLNFLIAVMEYFRARW